MPVIDLPSTPQPQSAEPYFMDMGGWQTPEIGGGDSIRLDRIGDRFGLAVQMPPMFFHDPKRGIHAREWISRLIRGSSQGVRMGFPQPNFSSSLYGGTLQTGFAAQSNVIIFPAANGSVILEGQFVTVRKLDGRRFLHQVQFSNTAADGSMYMVVSPRLRAPLVAGDAVHFVDLSIEGALVGDRRSWSLEMARTVGLSFEIVETR